MKKAYIVCEKEWMSGKKAWAIVDECGKTIKWCGCYKTKKGAVKALEAHYGTGYELQKKIIKLDCYAGMREIEAEKGFTRVHPTEFKPTLARLVK